MSESVTNRQLFFIIIIRIISGSVLEMPLIMAKKVGVGAWFVILISSILTCIPILLITYLGTKYKDKTLFDYSQILVGKFFSYLFTIIFIIYSFGALTLLVRSTSDIIQYKFLIKTPVFATMLLLIIILGYAASKKLKNLGRISEFLGTISLVFTIVLHLIMFARGDIRNVKPFFETSKLDIYFSTLPSTIFLFMGFESITIIPFSKENGKKSMLIAVISVISSGLLYAFICETTFMILGIKEMLNHKYPIIPAIRSIDLPFLEFFKRFDLVLINIWIYSIFCSISFILYTVTRYISKIFPKINFNLIIIIVCSVAFLLGLLPSSDKQTMDALVFITTYLGFIPALVIPLILFSVSKVKEYVKKPN